jgi:hypothetical protein
MNERWPFLKKLLAFNLINYGVIFLITNFVENPLESNPIVFFYSILGIQSMFWLGLASEFLFLLTRRWPFVALNCIGFIAAFAKLYLS